MDQEMAQVLLREGATLVFFDVPEGTEFGIDYNSWTVGPLFKGVKMIPPGIHFVYYSAVDKSKQVAPRTGFFFNFAPKQVLIKRWDPAAEDVRIEVVSEDDQETVERNKKDLDRFLGAYPYESYRKWISLTNNITPQLMSRLQPECGSISSVTAFSSPMSTTADRQRQMQEHPETDTDGLPEMQVVPGTAIRFTKIPERKYPKNATPAEITRHSMDHTYALQTLIKTVYSLDVDREEEVSMDTSSRSEPAATDNKSATQPPENVPDKDSGADSQQASHGAAGEKQLESKVEGSAANSVVIKTASSKAAQTAVLGELQFAFACFLIGQNFSGFEQWKHLLHLICSCGPGAPASLPDLYSGLIAMLHHQLAEIPSDFFVDIVTADNFLTRTLQSLFATLDDLADEAGEEGLTAQLASLRTRGLRFRDHLQKQFDWDFTNEPDEYAPVIVE